MMITIPSFPSTNNLYFNLPNGGRAPTAKYKAWQKSTGWLIKIQRPQPIKGRVAIDLAIGEDCGADIDNIKAILDLLKKLGLIEDDSTQFVRRLSIHVEEPVSGVEIRIEPIGGDPA
jgi:Holliday junction resolvase RusA-like endonuclease